MKRFSTDSRRVGDATHVALHGELDCATVPKLEGELDAVMAAVESDKLTAASVGRGRVIQHGQRFALMLREINDQIKAFAWRNH